MRVVVFGSSGMLGRAVSRFLAIRGYAVQPLTRREFDVAHGSFERLRGIVGNADAAVNCAGVIKPMIAQTNIEDVIFVNSIFSHNLALAAGEKPVIHVTTDCVYSGSRGTYDETDPVDAEDVYGLTKAAGDNARCMVLRTSIVGEEELPGRSLFAWAQSQAGKSVTGFTNHRWNGVTTTELSRIIADVLSDGRYKIGRFHVYSPEDVSKADLLQLFDETYELNLQITRAEAAVASDRTLRSIYDLTPALQIPPLREQLLTMRAFFSTH